MPADQAPHAMALLLRLPQPFDAGQASAALQISLDHAYTRLHAYRRRGLIDKEPLEASPQTYAVTEHGRALAATTTGQPMPEVLRRRIVHSPAPAPTPPAPISPERAAIRDLQRELATAEAERDQLRRRVADLEHRLARAPGAGGPARLAGLRP